MRGENVGLLLAIYWDVFAVRTQTQYILQLGRNDRPDKNWSTSEYPSLTTSSELSYEQKKKCGQVRVVDHACGTQFQYYERRVIAHLGPGAQIFKGISTDAQTCTSTQSHMD